MGKKRIVVAGAGPAGMMAAIRAAQCRAEAILIEKNSSAGKKLLLSGKGRCNLTNTCDITLFIERFSANGAFLRDAFKKFFYPQLMRFFEERGLRLKVERQLRVFPATDRSASILDILLTELKINRVTVLYNARLREILIERGSVNGCVLTDGRKIFSDRLILATGGGSYSFTGSDAEGIRVAERLGHRIVPLRPGLVHLIVRRRDLSRLEGLTLKNICLRFSDGSPKEILTPIGELLFTNSGISGPLVLSVSGKIVDWSATGKIISAEIDLKPALSEEQLDARLLREFKRNAKKTVKNTLKEVLPMRLIEIFLERAKIDPLKKASQIMHQERRRMVVWLKRFRLEGVGVGSLEEGMVTKGGVSLKDIHPRSMESRLVRGLYFAGEMIDVDADTGGFNLQAAFSTGYLAGESAAL